MPELSAETKQVLYYLLRDTMREGGELEDVFNSLFVADDDVEREGEVLQLWERIQKEVALFSGWCFVGLRAHAERDELNRQHQHEENERLLNLPSMRETDGE